MTTDRRPLGRHVEHDPRSRAHAFLAEAAPVPLRTVTHRHYGPVLHQGELGSCTGNGTAQVLNTKPLHKAGKPLLREADAVKIYSLATTLDPWPGTYPPEDTGSSGLAAAKAAQKLGYITAYKHAFSLEEALQALMAGPVITGVNWYEGFDTPDATGHVTVAGQLRGGHEFAVLGLELRLDHDRYDDAVVVCLNSWGKTYGAGGRFLMTVKTWRRLLDEQGDVTILQR